MPPQQCIGRNNRIQLQKRFAPDHLRFASEKRSLSIGEPNAFAFQFLLQ
jgi:hypothetical protein